MMIGSEGMISQADTAYNRSQSDLQAARISIMH